VNRRWWAQLLSVIAAAVAAVAVLTVIVWLSGYDVQAVLLALWRGAFGTGDAFLSATLVRATPLILTGLAVAVAFRAGIWNIGAEGQLLAGATAATAVALAAPAVWGLLLALIAGAAAGGVWAGIAAWLRQRFRVLEVISTIMLNFLAAYGVAYLVRGPLQEPSHIYPQTSSITPAARLPLLIPDSRLHAGLAIALAAAVSTWVVLRWTAPGFRLRASGANPFAAASAGLIDVASATMGAFLASGALAGLAGAVEVTGVTYALYENISPGYGYTAIAVALLAGLDPLAVIGTGILFGALEAGGAAMQRDAGVPSVIVSVVEATLILVVLLPIWRRRPALGAVAA
jgi:general nucleoside transport system permease protein